MLQLSVVEAAVIQPQMSMGGRELYRTIESKAAAIGMAIVSNHPFVDGNKRTGHAAMETFLILNGFELEASIDDSERTILLLASGQLDRAELEAWIADHLRPCSP